MVRAHVEQVESDVGRHYFRDLDHIEISEAFCPQRPLYHLVKRAVRRTRQVRHVQKALHALAVRVLPDRCSSWSRTVFFQHWNSPVVTPAVFALWAISRSSSKSSPASNLSVKRA